MSNSPYLCRRDEDKRVSRDHSNIPSNAKNLGVMSSKSLLQIWCERVQNASIALNLAPLQFGNLTLEKIPRQGSGTTIQRKRQRPLSDVDGEVSKSSKKRRLRLHLITSRLSRPFSFPATYIYNRDRSKSAWARKSIERGAIWKAAIVNRCRLRRLAAQQKREPEQRPRAILKPNFARHRPTVRPSPLGQSHFVAPDTDLEEGANSGGYVEDKCI